MARVAFWLSESCLKPFGAALKTSEKNCGTFLDRTKIWTLLHKSKHPWYFSDSNFEDLLWLVFQTPGGKKGSDNVTVHNSVTAVFSVSWSGLEALRWSPMQETFFYQNKCSNSNWIGQNKLDTTNLDWWWQCISGTNGMRELLLRSTCIYPYCSMSSVPNEARSNCTCH